MVILFIGGTNIHGSSGGSLLDNVYTDQQKEQIMNYYKQKYEYYRK